jgi:hypothetical protein
MEVNKMGMSRELKKQISDPNITDEKFNELLEAIRKQAPNCEFVKQNKPRVIKKVEVKKSTITKKVEDKKNTGFGDY